jgi:hypothetical protein
MAYTTVKLSAIPINTNPVTSLDTVVMTHDNGDGTFTDYRNDATTLGAQGLPGNNGATWYNGTTDPNSGTGVNGDYYLNTTSNEVFNKQSGSWVSIANIKGAQGDQGIQGVPGENGLDAAPHLLISNPFDGGIISTATLGASGGHGYAIGDIFIFDGGGGNATGVVESIVGVGAIINVTGVNGSGGVTGVFFPSDQGGTGYINGQYYHCSGGTGSGFMIHITSVDIDGQILTGTIYHAGTGYTIGDTLEVIGGAVATFYISNGGSNYGLTSNSTTTASSGSGSGCLVNITAVTNSKNYCINSFFSNDILQISKDQKAYIRDVDFTQSGTTIVASTFVFNFSDTFIAWS